MKAEFHFAGEPVAFAVAEPKVVQALLDGRARIAKGWCQNQFSVLRPENLGGDLFCPLESVYSDNAAIVYLYAALPGSVNSIISYNDTPGRTQADILLLFDRAIALARAA